MNRTSTTTFPTDCAKFPEPSYGPLTKNDKIVFLYESYSAVIDNIKMTDAKLIGEMLTLLEIALPDGQQLNALKQQTRAAIYRHQNELTDILDKNFDTLSEALELSKYCCESTSDSDNCDEEHGMEAPE
jgi:hypothetical protein